MISGTGDIGTILNDREGAIFFASGVSNSRETSKDEFEREIDLLDLFAATNKRNNDCLFYFSTISQYYSFSPYIFHKKTMECLVRKGFKNYNIIRIGNIDWGTNPNTFLNRLRAMKQRGEEFNVFDEYRYMISKEQLLLLTDNLPLKGQNEINVFGDMKKVKDLI